MRANELMIGDWVRYVDTKAPFQIEDVSGSAMFMRWTSDGQTAIPHTWSEIEPVPLTPEILEKNGERDNDAIYSLGDGYEWLELTVCADGSVWWTINLDEYQITRLRYVHELQHALRLCGIVKEIEL